MSKKTQNDSEDFFMNTDGDQISMIAEITTEPEGDDVLKMEFDKEFPVMPLRNMVMFPHVVMPVTIGRASTLKLINAAFKKKLPIMYLFRQFLFQELRCFSLRIRATCQ